MATPPRVPRHHGLGAIFEFGLQEISRAYRTTTKVQAELAAAIDADLRREHGIAPEAEFPEVECDDDGQPISFDFRDEIAERKAEAESTAGILRQAFLIALFHFWEKHSNRWIDQKSYRHVEVMDWLKCQGYAPDEDLLEDLQFAANCAKHGPGESCEKLFSCRQRRDLFDEVDADLPVEPGHHPNLKIDDATLEAFFEAVRRSGPRGRRPWDPP